MKHVIISWGALLLFLGISGMDSVSAQVRDFRIHDRGMIHQTVYNTGTIGRPWIVYARTNLPLMEWPPRSRTVIEGIEYDGHHNSWGAGVYVSANEEGKPGNDNRIFAFCGGIGTRTTTELPFGKWSFPISIEEIENFPLLPDGELNPNYNPDEAEEIIIAKWATPVGITITRTSRAWSYPDYDDMIIYEYELEYTGDTDGNPATIERTVRLMDVLFHINYGFGPTKMAYARWYGTPWFYGDTGGIYRTDQHYSMDPDYWLIWQTVTRTGAGDLEEKFAAKPEPNPELFMEFATTGKNGGGLLSAGCPGYAMLYWDSNHLAVVDPVNRDRNQSDYANFMLKDDGGNYFETDADGHILQPWNIKTGTPNTRSSKMIDRAATLDERWWTVYGEVGVPTGVPSDQGRFVLPGNRKWKGRARFEWDESYNGGMAITGFGPYVMELGDKLEFAYAEVVGYGGTPGKIALGGQRDRQFFPIRDWNRKVELDGQVLTEHYLDDFGYPDHINSDVITVNQVAHKAHEAYLGETIPYDPQRKGPAKGGRFPTGMIFPEDNPRPSENLNKYKIPVPFPAPVIEVRNTPRATVKLTWKRAVENFSHPRLSGALRKFYIYRADLSAGPFKLLDSLEVGQVNADNLYEYEDVDQTFRLGETKFYAVTSVDEHGNESGRTNFTAHAKNVAAAEKLDRVFAVPNPFVLRSGFEGKGQENAIGFFGLPKRATIRIFSFSGQLIETIEHDEDVFSTSWFQVTRNNQDIASGIYFYIVTTPEGDQYNGKFIVLK